PDVPDAGLNPALVHGAGRGRELAPDAGVGALSADLPALRPDELSRVLDVAARAAVSFVPDAAGIGTTLYTARPGVEFSPAVGGGSRARHRERGAREILLPGGRAAAAAARAAGEPRDGRRPDLGRDAVDLPDPVPGLTTAPAGARRGRVPGRDVPACGPPRAGPGHGDDPGLPDGPGTRRRPEHGSARDRAATVPGADAVRPTSCRPPGS